MSTDTEHLTVDRIESGIAVLIDDSGRPLEVPIRHLPEGVYGGAIVSAVRDPDGTIDWSTAELDEDEAEARLAEAEALLEELRRRDPGGDVAL